MYRWELTEFVDYFLKRRHQLSRPRHLTLILLTVHKMVIYIYRPIWQNNCT